MDGSSSKETSSRRSCREGNRPQPLEVASLLKLVATNVLFPNAGFFTRNFTGFDVSTPRCLRWVRKSLNSAQLVHACGA